MDILTLKPEFDGIGMKRDNESKEQRLKHLYRIIGKDISVHKATLDIINNECGKKYKVMTMDDLFFDVLRKRENRYRCVKGKRFFIKYHRHFNEGDWYREEKETEIIQIVDEVENDEGRDGTND